MQNQVRATQRYAMTPKATGWNDDNKLEGLFSEHGVEYLNEPVVTDGNIITRDGPRAAKAFGKAIINALEKS